MSYIPFRDNPDLAGIPEQAAAELEVLSEQIDQSSAIGNHQDACGCDNPKCDNLLDNLACHQAQSNEVVGWLFAKGWLAAPDEVVSAVPDPARAQLRLEIVEAIAAALGLAWPSDVDEAEAFEVVDKAVMPVVDELLARARHMREAAEAMAANLESQWFDLDGVAGELILRKEQLDTASSTNKTLLKLLHARDAQVVELTVAVTEKETERARLKKLYSDTHRELNLLHDAYDGDADDEVFCARCAAGVDSPEHHARCVVTGHAVDGETAEPAPLAIPAPVVDNDPAAADVLNLLRNRQARDLQHVARRQAEQGGGR